MSSLRREFGQAVHLAVTAAGGDVFVLAAGAAQENEVAITICRHGGHCVGAADRQPRDVHQDTNRLEWRHLREKLELEGEGRQS